MDVESGTAFVLESRIGSDGQMLKKKKRKERRSHGGEAEAEAGISDSEGWSQSAHCPPDVCFTLCKTNPSECSTD